MNKYTFRNRNLLTQALTHKSASSCNNERLEFIGDRVLNLVVAREVFKNFPSEREGGLAKRVASLVCTETLSEVAQELQLKLILSAKANIDRNNRLILANAVEAVIGAIYLDGGLEAAEAFILRQWSKRFRNGPKVDPKTHLQELSQARGWGLPRYELVDQSGPDHAPWFIVRVTVAGHVETSSGRSKKEAETKAAEAMITAHFKR
jgi:ribonuclease-3